MPSRRRWRARTLRHREWFDGLGRQYDFCVLVGRESVMRRLRGQIADLAAGAGFALAVRGNAGIGKSAVLDKAAQMAGQCKILRVFGTESESEVAFAGLSELAQQLLPDFELLPAQQREILRSVLGLSEADSSGTLPVLMAITALLAAGTRAGPRLFLVDDAQWLDGATAEALLFAARRLADVPVGFVFAIRSGVSSAFDASWLPTVVLSPLREMAARELVAAISPALPEPVADRVIEAAEGYPLALVEFAWMAGENPDRASAVEAEPLPLSDRLQRAYGAQTTALPEQAQQALTVLAAAGSTVPDVVWPAIAAVTGSAAALDPALDVGLVVVRDDRLTFRHPLVRSAVYQASSAASRRAAHRALAAEVADRHPERAAWHRALAASGPDEEVAAGLERTADLARRRGGHLAQARALVLAARLSSEPGEATRRLLAAGMAAQVAGQHDQSRALLREVTARTSDPLLLADAEHGLAQIAYWREGRRSTSLEEAATRVEPLDPGRAAVLLSFELPGMISDFCATSALPVAERAWRLIGHGTEPFEVSFRVAHVLIMAGRTTTAKALVDQSMLAVRAAGDPVAMINLSQPLWWLEDFVTARDLLDHATAEFRASGGLWMLCHALIYRSELERRTGQLRSAYSAAAEALAVAEQIDEQLARTEALYELAAAEAALGQEANAAEHAAEALAMTTKRTFGAAEIKVATASALGAAALAAGRPAEALERLLPAAELAMTDGVADPSVVPFVPDLVEAQAACGDTEAATALCDWLEENAAQCQRRWAQLAAVRCRLILGSASTDDLRAALDDYDGTVRLETARSLLALGAALRRSGQRADARTALRQAREIFEASGAAAWQAATATELRACGEKQATPVADPISLLTPQETRVAMLVAQGARSREVASSLFLSERTVESHLSAVYRKLGLRSRAQLAAYVGALPG